MNKAAQRLDYLVREDCKSHSKQVQNEPIPFHGTQHLFLHI